MDDLHSSTEVVLEELSCKPSMAVMRSRLAAEQTGSIKDVSRKQILHIPSVDQIDVCIGIDIPADLPLLVAFQNVVCRRQPQSVFIAHASKLLKEKSKVILLRESGQLGHIVQAGIQHLPDTAPLDQPKELACILLGEANRVESDGLAHWSCSGGDEGLGIGNPSALLTVGFILLLLDREGSLLCRCVTQEIQLQTF